MRVGWVGGWGECRTSQLGAHIIPGAGALGFKRATIPSANGLIIYFAEYFSTLFGYLFVDTVFTTTGTERNNRTNSLAQTAFEVRPTTTFNYISEDDDLCAYK